MINPEQSINFDGLIFPPQGIRIDDHQELHGPLRPVHGEHRDPGHEARDLEELEGRLQRDSNPQRCPRQTLNTRNVICIQTELKTETML